MATTTVPAGAQMIALRDICSDGNVRQQLHAEEVEAPRSRSSCSGS